MSSSIETLSALVEHAQTALHAAAVEADAASVDALTIAVLALHGRVARALATLPDVVGDDVPWSAIGDRDLYVSAVAGALTLQRGRIAALSERHDHVGIVASCRLSLQTLGAVVRDVERIFPVLPAPECSQRSASRPEATPVVSRPRFRAGPLDTATATGPTGPVRPVGPSGVRAAPAA